MTSLAKDPAPQGNADRAGKLEVVSRQFDTDLNTTSTALRLAEARIRQRYGLPGVRARLVARLANLGGEQS
ncbi:MAG: hypothetical protein MnENMB40S_28710 [Rhizobiaceae bacterium MnEN-MB40S]|nr:MAG: hypothetical protein MnENMB40S_28710 [Rhizobiaceae bacterium MnEN-MB40S]